MAEVINDLVTGSEAGGFAGGQTKEMQKGRIDSLDFVGMVGQDRRSGGVAMISI